MKVIGKLSFGSRIPARGEILRHWLTGPLICHANLRMEKTKDIETLNIFSIKLI